MTERWLAPLRGVTIRAFREAFAVPLREAGFTGAFAPFIPANPGLRVNARMLSDLADGRDETFPVVPQVITKHPDAMRTLLTAFREAGFARADLNAGCPFPMIVRRGRGSGLLAAPETLVRLLDVGCEVMGPGRFSLKVRLGRTAPDELLALMPRINQYPLACVTIHARTARQMYAGTPDLDAFAAAAAASVHPVLYNGDIGLADFAACPREEEAVLRRPRVTGVMIGRGFVRMLGARPDAAACLTDYLERSCAELSGDRPVLGRLKELLDYWRVHAHWARLWPVAKLCRTVDEFRSLLT